MGNKIKTIAQELAALKLTWTHDAADMYDVLDGINCFQCDAKITFWVPVYVTENPEPTVNNKVYCCSKCFQASYGKVDDKIDSKLYAKPSHTPLCYRGAQFLDAFYVYADETAAFYANKTELTGEADQDNPIWVFLEAALDFEEAVVSFRREQIAYEGYGSQNRNLKSHKSTYSSHEATVKCNIAKCKVKMCYLNTCAKDHIHPLVHYAETGHLDNATI